MGWRGLPKLVQWRQEDSGLKSWWFETSGHGKKAMTHPPGLQENHGLLWFEMLKISISYVSYQYLPYCGPIGLSMLHGRHELPHNQNLETHVCIYVNDLNLYIHICIYIHMYVCVSKCLCVCIYIPIILHPGLRCLHLALYRFYLGTVWTIPKSETWRPTSHFWCMEQCGTLFSSPAVACGCHGWCKGCWALSRDVFSSSCYAPGMEVDLYLVLSICLYVIYIYIYSRDMMRSFFILWIQFDIYFSKNSLQATTHRHTWIFGYLMLLWYAVV